MILMERIILLLLQMWSCASATALSAVDTTSLKAIANLSHADLNTSESLFSPRMDFDQWKPLTGRGDPLHNDPTYDYEPPILERVHYWAEDTRLEREHYPERKSEVLMLGVSSRKPSVASRPPLPPPRRQHHRPQPPKYEDFTYKLGDHYPMTILVPPPPPPHGHQPSLFILPDNKLPVRVLQTKPTVSPNLVTRDTTPATEHQTSLYALQEANLIYQSSTTSQNWIIDSNHTKSIPNVAVSSDYAGWGPTTPIDINDSVNDTHNLISNDHIDFSKSQYSFYKPMLSEAPPPPQVTDNPLLLSTYFVPTALPPTDTTQSTTAVNQETWPPEGFTSVTSTNTQDYYEETTTSSPPQRPQSEKSFFDMLGPMMTMPLVNGPDRPEDNLYAHASENLHVYKEHQTEDAVTLETMQTMQPPPIIKSTESTTLSHAPFHVNTHVLNRIVHKNPVMHTHDPYLHMRYTTATPSTDDNFENSKSTTEGPTVPMYLIIQGHSKVKTYGSKSKLPDDNHTISNEIPKQNITNEVKHLHPKGKHSKSDDVIEERNTSRTSRAQNLKSVVETGLGSIEIQETDVGIKYDVSDGSEVPAEIYRRGIVDADENDYTSSKNKNKENRNRRQVDLEDLLPFDEDTLEEYVYDFLKGRRNDTGITGLIAQAVTSDEAKVVDELEDDDDEDQEDEER